MEKRKKKSIIKYCGGANENGKNRSRRNTGNGNEIRRNRSRSPNRSRRPNRRNRSRSPNRRNISRRNRGNENSINSIWRDSPLSYYSQEPTKIPNRGRGRSYLGRDTQSLQIKITNGFQNFFTYFVQATNETKIEDLKNRILNNPSIPSLNREIKAMGLVWGENCTLRSSNNMERLDNLDGNPTLGQIDEGKNENSRIFYPGREIGDGKILLGGTLLVMVTKKFISYGHPEKEEKKKFDPRKYPNNVLRKAGLLQFMKP